MWNIFCVKIVKQMRTRNNIVIPLLRVTHFIIPADAFAGNYDEVNMAMSNPNSRGIHEPRHELQYYNGLRKLKEKLNQKATQAVKYN